MIYMIFILYATRQEQISPMWRRHWALFGQDPISADPSLPMFAEARMHESTLWVESFLRWNCWENFLRKGAMEFSMWYIYIYIWIFWSWIYLYIWHMFLPSGLVGLFDCFLLFFRFTFYCVIAVGMENWSPHYWNHICMYGVNGYEAHFKTISLSNGLIRPLFLR